MSMLTVGKDECQKEEHEWINPLSLDRVNDNRRSGSSCRLLQLPVELLGTIAAHIPWSTLFDFALTCRDNCALARSRLFAEVKLDYSPRSEQVLGAIGAEITERKYRGFTILPSIGACVRSLTVATSASNAYARHHVHVSNAEPLGSEETLKRSEEGAAFYYETYHTAIALALESGLANLTTLRWYDKVVAPHHVLGAICCSPVQYLNLYEIQVDEDVDLDEYLTHRGVIARFALRALNFTLSWAIDTESMQDTETSSTKDSLLSLCASTLERLSWSELIRGPGFRLPPSMVPCFTRLRELRLSYVTFDDPGYYMALIPRLSTDRIRILDVSPDQISATTQFFKTRGEISSLQAFIWRQPPDSDANEPLEKGDGGIQFLKANPHISKLQLDRATHPLFLNNGILPLVTNRLHHLKSLSLIWDCEDIPQCSLQMLSQITSLQKLHISAGQQLGWYHSWLIKHRMVRKTLQPLQQLEILAFSRDSYNPGFTKGILSDEHFQAFVDQYYIARLPKRMVIQLNEGLHDEGGLDTEEQSSQDHHEDQFDEYDEDDGSSAEDDSNQHDDRWLEKHNNDTDEQTDGERQNLDQTHGGPQQNEDQDDDDIENSQNHI
ncbi:MAG: hypothetical protein Q9157_006462 [Trypethelium eluteriae]